MRVFKIFFAGCDVCKIVREVERAIDFCKLLSQVVNVTIEQVGRADSSLGNPLENLISYGIGAKASENAFEQDLDGFKEI